MEDQIDVKNDGRIVLYKRSSAPDAVYQVRLRVPGSNGYKRCSTKLSNPREAEHFALNLYEELYFHVRDGGSLNAPRFAKAFDSWKKVRKEKYNAEKRELGSNHSDGRDVRSGLLQGCAVRQDW